MIGPILARIEDLETCKPAKIEPPVKLRIRSVRPRSRSKRHMFVVSAVGRSAPEQETRGIIRSWILGKLPGVIVAHLMVVPRNDPRNEGMRRLQNGIQFVDGVTSTVVVEVLSLRQTMGAHRTGSIRVFVDIVAQEKNEISLIGQTNGASKFSENNFAAASA